MVDSFKEQGVTSSASGKEEGTLAYLVDNFNNIIEPSVRNELLVLRRNVHLLILAQLPLLI